MANIKNPEEQSGGAPIGSRQGGAPGRPNETELNDQGRVHKTRTERARLAEDPNLNQAGNDRGSADQTQGSQTGNDIDTIPDVER
jgi:hypothetical protein